MSVATASAVTGGAGWLNTWRGDGLEPCYMGILACGVPVTVGNAESVGIGNTCISALKSKGCDRSTRTL